MKEKWARNISGKLRRSIIGISCFNSMCLQFIPVKTIDIYHLLLEALIGLASSYRKVLRMHYVLSDSVCLSSLKLQFHLPFNTIVNTMHLLLRYRYRYALTNTNTKISCLYTDTFDNILQFVHGAVEILKSKYLSLINLTTQFLVSPCPFLLQYKVMTLLTVYVGTHVYASIAVFVFVLFCFVLFFGCLIVILHQIMIIFCEGAWLYDVIDVI